MNESEMIDIAKLWRTVKKKKKDVGTQVVWDIHFSCLSIHLSQGSKFYSLLLMLVRSPHSYKRGGVAQEQWGKQKWREVYMPLLYVLIQELQVWFSSVTHFCCLSGSIQCTNVLLEWSANKSCCPSSVSANPWWLSRFTRWCGGKLHSKVATRRLVLCVKPCKNLVLKTTTKGKRFFSAWMVNALNLFSVFSLLPLLCGYISLHLHLGQTFLGLYILWIKGLLRKFPIRFDFLPLPAWTVCS